MVVFSLLYMEKRTEIGLLSTKDIFMQRESNYKSNKTNKSILIAELSENSFNDLT